MIGKLYQKAFTARAAELVRLDAGVRFTNDPEAVHDARVALRHLRSYLKTFRPILDRKWAEGLRGRMRWLDEHLAEARDLDVLVATFERATEEPESPLASAPPDLLERLRAERDGRHERVREALREPRYLSLLEEIVEAARRPRFRKRAKRRARGAMPKLLHSVWRRARKRIGAYDAAPSHASLHAIRRQAKHVRYAAETFEALAGKRAEKLACHAKSLQSMLGKHHDAVMAAARLRAHPQASPESGRLPTAPAWRPIWDKMSAAYAGFE